MEAIKAGKGKQLYITSILKPIEVERDVLQTQLCVTVKWPHTFGHTVLAYYKNGIHLFILYQISFSVLD